jgi:hypothetical protein
MRSLLLIAVLAAGALAGCETSPPPGPRLDDTASRCPCCTVPNCKCGECKDTGGCPCPPESPNDKPALPGGPVPNGPTAN